MISLSLSAFPACAFSSSVSEANLNIILLSSRRALDLPPLNSRLLLMYSCQSSRNSPFKTRVLSPVLLFLSSVWCKINIVRNRIFVLFLGCYRTGPKLQLFVTDQRDCRIWLQAVLGLTCRVSKLFFIANGEHY